jgi:hypothetical protein
MALLTGSPAIDHGTNFGNATDQRGRPRTFDFPDVANSPGGNGTDIGAFELNSALLNIVRSGTLVQLSWPTNDPTFVLESTTNIGQSAMWTNVPGHPAVLNGRFALVDIMAGSRFYRLRSP